MAPDHDDRADAHIDAALEALARPAPPAEHVARVLHRTGPASVPHEGNGAAPRRRPGLRPAVYVGPRWALPVAATLLLALGASWQVGRLRLAAPEGSRWGAPREVVQPVLPPPAYWAMDPFEEFRTLRPDVRSTGAPQPPILAAGMSAEDELGWAPETARSESSGLYPLLLPSIELVPIEPALLAVTPLAPLEDIALAEIPLAPIVVAPFIAEEKP